MSTKKNKKSRLRSLFKLINFYFLLALITVFVVFLTRVFVFASFTISSDSMNPTLITGDRVFVNKLIFGAHILTSLNFKDGIKTKRVKGLRKIRRNEVVIFNFPYKNSWNKIDIDFNQHYVKRCVALPGDTFKIENGFFKVVGCSDTLGIYFNQNRVSEMSYEDLRKRHGIFNSFPNDSTYYDWNIKDFGPLYIPKAGDCLAIDTTNYCLYKNIIEYETGKTMSKRNSAVFLDAEQIGDYTFSGNYYFLAGDYNQDSQDSRYWGAVPEDCIVGVATHIWYSKDIQKARLRKERILKKIK